jgi:hypothetical protein
VLWHRYGKLGDLIAFRAAIELLVESGKGQLLQEVYREAREEILRTCMMRSGN